MLKNRTINVNKFIFTILLFVYMFNTSIYSLPMNELLRWVFIICLLLFLVINIIREQKKIKVPKYFIFLFIPYISLINLLTDQGLVMSCVRSMSFIIVFLTLFLLFFYIDDNDKNDYINIFGLILSICTILNFFEYIRDPNIGAFMGIYANKNYLITIVLVSSIFSIKYIINHRIILGGILFILNSLMNFATGSRVGMVCYVFLLFFSGLLFLKKIDFSGVIKLFCIIMMLGLLLYLITHYFDIPALKRIFFDDGTAATGLSRGETWNAAIPIFFSKPIFGWGNNIVYLNIHHMTQIGNNFYWGFHNSYLVFICETGIIGSISYFIFIFTIVKNSFKKFFLEENIRICLFVVVLLLINSMSEAFLFAVGNFASICFWLPICYLISKK